MQYRQRRMAHLAHFDFGADKLAYAVQDNSGRAEFEIDYANIPHNKRLVFQRNNWLRNVGLLWIVIGFISLAAAAMAGDGLAGRGFWLIIGLFCLAFYRATWTDFTVFDTPQGSLFVLKDKQHDEIVEALLTRRRAKLLSAYGRLDLENDPQREISKIEWLVENKVLTREEGDAQISQVRANRALPAPEDARKLH